MSEEVKESGGTSLKTILIGIASTVSLAIGGVVAKKISGEKEEEKPAVQQPVININNTNQQAAGKTVVVKEKAADAKPAQPAPAPKKKEGDEFKDKPAQW